MFMKLNVQTERDSKRDYTAALTTCTGTWLEHPPDADEQQRIDAAFKLLREQRRIAIEFHRDPEAANLFSIELFRGKVFRPLHLEDWLIERILNNIGEPPVVEEGDERTFTNYLQRAVLSIAAPHFRRSLAGQLRRFLPQYVEAGRWKEAVAIDYNAFRTSLGNEVSPFLVQMTLEGLARWYEMHEDDAEST
jgi:hypothetical protein